MNAQKIAELEKLAGTVPASRLFNPDTFLKGDGTVSGQIRPQGGMWNSSITVSTAVLILKNLDEFTQAALDAIAMAKRPGEAERLAALKAAREGKKAAKATPAAPIAGAAAKRQAELEAELASLEG
jgi:hypothetical protein